MKIKLLFFLLLLALPGLKLPAQDLPKQVDDLEKKVAALEATLQKLTTQVDESAVPVGTIVAFGGPESQIPDGWLHCNGKPYDASSYPKLAEVLAKSWGGNSSGTRFNVPDLRGQFLRGWDENADVDPDKLARTSKNGGKSGNNVGSYQEDATSLPNQEFRGNTNSTGQHQHTIGASQTGTTGIHRELDDNVFQGTHWDYKTSAAGEHSHSVTITNGGDAETRPTNACVLYIIKAE